MLKFERAGLAGERGSCTRTRRVWLAIATASLIATSPLSAAAGENGDMARDAGIGWGAALTSLVYAPLKVVYATGGVIVGGLAYVFSGGDQSVAKTVITPAVLGDYVVTTEHVRGERPLEFLGRKPGYEADAYETESDYAADWDEPAADTSDVAAAPDGW